MLDITKLLSSSMADVMNKEMVEEKVILFLDNFLTLYHTKHITPYMHAFRWHVPEFIALYGAIAQFTQQGLEKMNDRTTKYFFRSTNQRGVEFLEQVIF